MSSHNESIFISAGDPSGDIAGSHLIKQLKSRRDDLEFFGLGGRRMLDLSQEQFVDGKKLAVLGFWEVAKKSYFFKKLLSMTAHEIKIRKPKAIILIDYPGFNLRLARKTKPLGIPIIYYISPQIWAWHAGRIHTLKKLVDLMLLILPFEKKIFDEAGIQNKFVGHYLLDDIDNKFINASFNSESKSILLMPGSRPQEVQRMLPTMIDSANILSRDKDLKFVVAGAGGDIDYDKYLKKSSIPIKVAFDQTRELIAESRLVITSSGTATLEAGIIGRPMVVIYKTGWLTFQIARRLVQLDKIALINIVAGQKLVPELIQSEANPQNIVHEARKFLDNTNRSLMTVRHLCETVKSLGNSGTAARAADAIVELIRC